MNIDIDAQTENHLKAIAASSNLAPETLAAEMITQQIQEKTLYWKERAEDMASLNAMKEGDYTTQTEIFTKIDRMIEDAKTLTQ